MGGKIKHTIEDVAWALANINRFSGNFGPYSVAQHSCLVSDICNGSYNALHHDGHEAWTGDVPTPVKNCLNLLGNNVWRTFEHDVAKRYRHYWGVANPMPAYVKKADTLALRLEVARIVPNSAKSAFLATGVEPIYISEFTIQDVWSPDKAYSEFLEYHHRLGPTGRRK